MSHSIPKEFHNSKFDQPVAKTVSELIEQLKRLPGNLPVEAGSNAGCKLIVYNIMSEDRFLELEEVDW